MAYPKLTFFSKDEQALNEMLFSALSSPIPPHSKSPTSLVVASTPIEDEIPSS